MAKNSKRKFSYIMVVLFLSVAVIFVVSLVAISKEIKEKKAEVAQLESTCEAQEAENNELQSMVDSGNEDEYLEKVAREKYGYINQGDRVYQDIASGE